MRYESNDSNDRYESKRDIGIFVLGRCAREDRGSVASKASISAKKPSRCVFRYFRGFRGRMSDLRILSLEFARSRIDGRSDARRRERPRRIDPRPIGLSFPIGETYISKQARAIARPDGSFSSRFFPRYARAETHRPVAGETPCLPVSLSP